ncbi:MAG: hypothetical protein LBT92_01145, partial [Rickettsiales bacterium]|nr:hypothetical protein [Rickettsiales bacterium]
YALKADIPGAADTSGFATKAEVAAVKASIPAAMDLSKYALKTDIPAAANLAEYAKKAEIPAIPAAMDLSKYALKTEVPQHIFAKGTKLILMETKTPPPGWKECEKKEGYYEGQVARLPPNFHLYAQHFETSRIGVKTSAGGNGVAVEAQIGLDIQLLCIEKL